MKWKTFISQLVRLQCAVPLGILSFANPVVATDPHLGLLPGSFRLCRPNGG